MFHVHSKSFLCVLTRVGNAIPKVVLVGGLKTIKTIVFHHWIKKLGKSFCSKTGEPDTSDLKHV